MSDGKPVWQPIEITSKSGLRFRMHPMLGLALGDFRHNAETNQMEEVPHPSDIADVSPACAVALAKELGYTQDADGVWCDPMLNIGDMFKSLAPEPPEEA